MHELHKRPILRQEVLFRAVRRYSDCMCGTVRVKVADSTFEINLRLFRHFAEIVREYLNALLSNCSENFSDYWIITVHTANRKA